MVTPVQLVYHVNKSLKTDAFMYETNPNYRAAVLLKRNT